MKENNVVTSYKCDDFNDTSNKKNVLIVKLDR